MLLSLLNVTKSSCSSVSARLRLLNNNNNVVLGSNLAAMTLSELSLGGVRGKKIMTGGSTRNKAGFPRGKKRGVKVYDGQRVSEGTTLVAQRRLDVMPGWNTHIGSMNSLVSTCHGRVMITTENMQPDYDSEDIRVQIAFPEHIRSESMLRLHIHVIPDDRHQYFKLVEQI